MLSVFHYGTTMMPKNKFHINDAGEVNPCDASKTICKFASREHFDSEIEARAAYEEEMAAANTTQVSKFDQQVNVNSTNLNKEADREKIEPVLRKIGIETVRAAEEIYNKELPEIIKKTTSYDGEFRISVNADIQFDGAANEIIPTVIPDIKFKRDGKHDPFELAQQLIVSGLFARLIDKTPS